MANDDMAADALAEAAAARRAVEQLAGRVTGLVNVSDDHERVLGTLAEQLDILAELVGAKTPEFRLSPWWWPTMNREQAREAWDAITAWVDAVFLVRYDSGGVPTDGGGKVLPGRLAQGERVRSCWFAHPDALDKLSALHWAWRGDYRRNASPSGPIEFQENWVPKTLEQIERIQRNCGTNCQVLPGKPVQVPRNQNDEFVGWELRTHWIKGDIDRRRPASS